MIRSQAGFTLIELLIVLSIISLLTVFGLIGFHNFNRGQSLKLAAQELKTNLRFAQNSALSGLTGCSDPVTSGGLFQGYQAIFTKDKTTYQIAEKCAGGTATPVVRSYNLPALDLVKIAGFTPSGSAPAASCQTAGQGVTDENLCVTFLPVNQGVSFYSSDAAAVLVTITLRSQTSGDYQVVVTKTGDIYEKKP